MIAALDFGSSLTKALVFDGKEFRLFKFSLSYSPQQFSRKNVLESIKILQNLSGCELLDHTNSPLYKLYVCTELPLFGDSSEGNSPYQTLPASKVLSSWEMPVLDCGYQFVRFKEFVSVQNLDESEVLKWLPFKSTLSEIENYINNRRLYSNVIPIFPRDLYIEQALARESIIQFFRTHNVPDDYNEVVISGSIFGTSPFPAQSLLILLDSLNFTKKLDIYLDRQSSILTLGILKLMAPEVYEQAPKSLRPVFLGSVLRFEGGAQLKINLGLEKPSKVSISSGDLFLFPLRNGEKATVEVLEAGNKTEEFQVFGGDLGFVIDCRGYPPKLSPDVQRRIETLKEWEKSVGATGRIYSI